jgi:hypothetical protein
MLSSLYLIYWIVNTVGNVFAWAIGITATLIAIALINQVSRLSGGQEYSDEDKIILTKIGKILRKGAIVLIALIITSVVMPKGQEVIPYLALRQIDKYNEEHPNSTFNPNNAMQLVDRTVFRLESIFINMTSNAERIMDGTANIVEGAGKAANNAADRIRK